MMNSGLSASDVAVLSGSTNRGCNDNGAFGYGAEWILWLVIILAIFNGGWGFGGWGGNGGGTNTPGFQGFATRSDIDAALSTQGIESGITGIGTQLCNGFNSVNSNISNLGYNLQNCCCDLKQGLGEVNYNLAAQTNILQNTVNNNGTAIQQALCSGFRDVIESQNAGTQRIVDLITQDKIATLQSENQTLKFAASQANQNAVLQAAMDANTAEIIRRTGSDCPIPAYVVPNPNCCYGNPLGVGYYGNYNNGCGCNSCC